MFKGRPVWQIIVLILAFTGLGYYIIKTFILEELSNTFDAFVFMISCVLLAIFAYFFKRPKSKE